MAAEAESGQRRTESAQLGWHWLHEPDREAVPGLVVLDENAAGGKNIVVTGQRMHLAMLLANPKTRLEGPIKPRHLRLAEPTEPPEPDEPGQPILGQPVPEPGQPVPGQPIPGQPVPGQPVPEPVGPSVGGSPRDGETAAGRADSYRREVLTQFLAAQGMAPKVPPVRILRKRNSWRVGDLPGAGDHIVMVGHLEDVLGGLPSEMPVGTTLVYMGSSDPFRFFKLTLPAPPAAEGSLAGRLDGVSPAD